MKITFLKSPSLVIVLCCAWYFSAGQQVTDTVTSLRNQGLKQAIYKAPNGRLYKVQYWKDPFAKGPGTLSAQCGEDKFKGKARKGPKTSVVKSTALQVASIRQLIATLPADTTMIRKLKPLPPQQKNVRLPEEKKNIRLSKGIFLYAIKREPDNDYHLIIGDGANWKTAVFLNVEVSGISDADVVMLQKLRDFFEDNFVDVCGEKYVVFIDNPIAITIEGSLFYDIDHKPGEVGPGKLKPKTSWELHPVTKIKAL